jgi:hypothetical protein
MKSHVIKCWPEYFQPLAIGQKSFEIRKNDRDYNLGDTLIIKEWNPETGKDTGRWVCKTITYMIQGKFGLPEDVCVLQLR